MTQSKYSILQVRLLLLVLMMILHVLLRLEKAAAIPCRSWRFPSSAAAFGMIPQQQRLPIRHRHFWDHRSPLSSRPFSSLAAENNNGRRPLPPQLDEWNYEDGFGAYDFDGFDEYDIEDMNSEAFVMGDDGMMYPKPKKQSTIDTDDQTMVMEAGQVEEERIVESSLTSTSLFPSVDGNKQDSFDEKAKEDKNRFNGISSEETMSQTTPTSTSSCRQTDEKEEDKTKNVPSREEFRHRGVQTQRHDEEFFKRASLGTGVTTELDRMEDQLEEYKHELIVATNNKKFNPNSPRQISVALYGYTGESTNKDVLEAMAANGNRIADLVIKYRSLNREINKRKKRQENKEKGTYAKSVYTVKRAAKSDPADDSAETEEQLNGMKSSPQQSKSETESGSETKSSKSNPVSVSKDEDPVLLVDASAYIFRAYYAYPPLHRADGMPIGAVLGFCNMLNRLVLNAMMNGEQPRVVLVFDAPGKNFRHAIYEEYKANRAEAPVDLIPQFPLIREVAKAYGIAQVEAPQYEADDVIATLATMALQEGIDTNILSGDKDLMQLVTPTDITPSVQIIDPMSMNRVSYEDVVDKWGVGPEKLGDVLALAGDASDNVPGVPGIGPKIAATLIDDFGSLDSLLENMDSVKQKGRREKLKSNLEQARLSRQLVELQRHVPMDVISFPEGINKVADLRMKPMDVDSLLDFFDEMGLRDLKSRFEQRLKSHRGFKWNPPTSNGKQGSAPAKKSKFYKREKAGIPNPDDFSDVPF